MDLESTLRKASYKVWEELEPVNKTNTLLFSVREEALTTMALKTIAMSNCNKICRIAMISPKEEKIRGYDFEICVGSASKRKFVRFFIQAKKLNGHTLRSSYREYHDSQNTNLEKYSTGYKSIPLYALYNHLEENDSDLTSFYNSNSSYDKRALGITLSTTTKIKIKGKKKFKDIHRSKIQEYYRRPFLRYHPLDKEFYEDNIQAGVPFHELAFFTIEKAEEFNERYRKNKRKSKLLYYYFYYDSRLFDDGDELIPIHNKSVEQLQEEFYTRSDDNDAVKNNLFSSRALIIINQDDK